MKLRTNLLFTSLLAAAPLVAGASVYRARQARIGEEDRLEAIVLARLEDGDLELLETDPKNFPMSRFDFGPGRKQRMQPRGGRGGPSGPSGPSGPGGPGGRDQRRPGGGPGAGRGPGGRAEMPRDLSMVPRYEILAYDAVFDSEIHGIPPLPRELEVALETGERRASQEIERDGSYLFQVAFRTEWSDSPAAVVLITRHSPMRMPRARDFLASGLLAGGLVLVVSLLAAGPLVARIRRLTLALEPDDSVDPVAPIDGEFLKGRDEIAELARSLDRSRACLRGALEDVASREQGLRQFVENTTHDVAIPLTVLQGHLASLADNADNPAALSGAMEEAHYVAAILRNLSTVARLEAGEQALERGDVDLGAVVERSVARHLAIARQLNVSLESSVPAETLTVVGNVTLLEEAVSNLVHNALRYNHAGGHVAVVLGTSEAAREGDYWLRVVDDGPGIAPNDLAQLTARAGRSDSARERHPDGRGLGLHIVLDVAARHDLEVSFDKGPEGGLEVTLRPKA
ncbi:MAG: two-component system sensor histidine kinase BaeS [Planctomycetota bacterium]|jgi:two-component system sensor histidine kinase BaeS